jgi:hypothetical protein
MENLPHGGIYSIRQISNGFYYVGQATDVAKRIDNHIYNAKRKPKQLIDKKIAQHGHEAFEFRLICCSLSRHFLDELEIYFIHQYDCLSPYGYNKRKGGQGIRGTPRLPKRPTAPQKRSKKFIPPLTPEKYEEAAAFVGICKTSKIYSACYDVFVKQVHQADACRRNDLLGSGNMTGYVDKLLDYLNGKLTEPKQARELRYEVPEIPEVDLMYALDVLTRYRGMQHSDKEVAALREIFLLGRTVSKSASSNGTTVMKVRLRLTRIEDLYYSGELNEYRRRDEAARLSLMFGGAQPSTDHHEELPAKPIRRECKPEQPSQPSKRKTTGRGVKYPKLDDQSLIRDVLDELNYKGTLLLRAARLVFVHGYSVETAAKESSAATERLMSICEAVHAARLRQQLEQEQQIA